MSEGADEGLVTKGLGGALYALASGLIGWATSGFLHTALGYLLAIAGAVLGLWFSLLNRRYAGVLAASALPADNDEREGYLALRRSLAEGGAVARLYAARLNRFLAGVERFFGDEGMAGRSLFPHAFGLRTAAPLWTAPAFDRCLLLALIYPVVTIFLIWVVSGHVGPAEASLGLPPGLAMWQRLATVVSAGVATFAMWRSIACETRAAIAWVMVAIFAVTVASAIARAGIGAVAVAGAVSGAASGVGAGALAIASTVAVACAAAAALTPMLADPLAIGVGVTPIAAAGVVGFTIGILYKTSIRNRWQGVFICAIITLVGGAFFFVLLSIIFVKYVEFICAAYPLFRNSYHC